MREEVTEVLSSILFLNEAHYYRIFIPFQNVFEISILVILLACDMHLPHILQRSKK